MQRQQDRGYTFVELLVVIVIIGILATIALPKFAATKDKALLVFYGTAGPLGAATTEGRSACTP